LYGLLGEYGIHVSQADDEIGQARADAWLNVIDLMKPMPELPMALAAYRLGFNGTTRNLPESILNRASIIDPKWQSIAIDIGEAPTASEVVNWYWRGLFTDEVEARKYLSWAGVVQPRQQDLILSSYPPIDVSAVLSLSLRGLLQPGEFEKYLSRLGYANNRDQELIGSLRNELPTPSDLVRFAVRHIFEPSLAMQFGFNDEISPDFIDWHSKLGFGYPVQITDPIDGQQYNINWAQAQWWSHWVWPSPTQGYEFLQRLRPTGGPNNGPRDPSGLVFTNEQLRLLLRGNDYPPIFRPMLQAISYRVLTRVDIRRMYAAGLITDRELTEYYQDMGYHKRDADKLAGFARYLKDDADRKALIKIQKARIVKAYRIGILDQTTAHTQLIAIGVDPQIATAELTGADSEEKIDLAVQAISSLRSSYLRYEIDANQARQALAQVGVNAVRINELLQSWQWQIFGRGKHLAVGQINKAVVRGTMDAATAYSRLRAMGYNAQDAQVIITLASEDAQLYQAKVQAASARTQQQRQNALVRQQKALQQQQRQVQHQLAQQAPESKLLRWFAKGIVNEAEVRMRLSQQGKDQTYINRVMEDATRKLSYTAKKRASVIVETPIPPTQEKSGG
jgi:hypothetical protein